MAAAHAYFHDKETIAMNTLARTALGAALTASIVLGLAAAASANCRIHNDTGVSFTIQSGNVSNQRVGGHTTTSIDDGRIVAEGDDGRTVGGMCEDGGSVEIREEHGTLVIVPN